VDTKNWDVFRNLPPETDSESIEDQTCYRFIIKSLKVSTKSSSVFSLQTHSFHTSCHRGLHDDDRIGLVMIAFQEKTKSILIEMTNDCWSMNDDGWELGLGGRMRITMIFVFIESNGQVR
jgi:hypothetical protein